MEAAAPTRASALRGCSGRRRTNRSQDLGRGRGGWALKMTLTGGGKGRGLSWQVQVPGRGGQGEGKVGDGGETRTWPPLALAVSA